MVEESEVGAAMALTAWGTHLVAVSSLKYLGWVLLALDYEWPEVIRNLRIVRKNWTWLSQVLGREGGDARTLEMFYIVLVQAVIK